MTGINAKPGRDQLRAFLGEEAPRSPLSLSDEAKAKSEDLLVMKPEANLGINFPWIVVMKASKGKAVVQ